MGDVAINKRGAGAVVERRMGDAGGADLVGIDRDLEGRPAAGAERVGEEVELGPEVRLERAGTGEFAVSEQRALGPDDGGEAGAATMSLRLTLWP